MPRECFFRDAAWVPGCRACEERNSWPTEAAGHSRFHEANQRTGAQHQGNPRLHG
ncbi:hypothetical protein A176_002663 [Myxococcus hansupus]|uniref:Uncharacterized protein n=1 Tax=Pseudomyxococcus hansupus TaxID=1297742 RepID=A0A0H4WQE6_9BACT|nr:hypothetical protein A176_002663 [Myxococcus hansupus]